MVFTKHSDLEGQHAFLGASKYHWINYDDQKLEESFRKWQAVQRGTELHAFAANAIKLGIHLPRTMKTLNMYVNDAITYKMTPEQPLYYSRNCFGTADAIAYDSNERYLRIHDLKTGQSRTSIHQLEIYSALFCLEYGVDPYEIETELRIYQNDDVLVEHCEPDQIITIMDKIVRFDKQIEALQHNT